jgi:N-acetylglutamate synthase-like GNAT family acetyltransferase
MIEIIPFEPQYQQGVIDVILPIQQIEFGVQITLVDQPDLQIIPSFYQQGNGNFWVALEAQTVIGTIALIDIGHQQVALRKMFVKADYRGADRGVSKCLLDQVFTWCQDRQIQDIYLGTVAILKAAHRFYEKNGFQEIAKTDLPEKFPIMAIDTKFYHYQF